MIPRLRVERRLEQPRWLRAAVPAASIAAGLLMGGVLLLALGIDPVSAYRRIFGSAFFGGWYSLSDTAVKATPLILCGLACALAFRMDLWNVGAEGQLALGAWAAAGVATFWLPAGTPAAVMLPAMMAAGFLAGALWGLVPGALKARLGVSEIITSLMLVYVARQWNNYWIYGPWSDRGFQLTPLFPREAWLPRLLDLAERFPALRGLSAHAGFVLALAAVAAAWVFLDRTALGYEIRVAGRNPLAAREAGIRVGLLTLLVMALSGGIAGLAGAVEVSGVVHRLQERFSPDYGFTGIIVAWLARLSPPAVVLVAVLLGGLLVGAKEIQPASIPVMLEGVILFAVIGGDAALRYRVRLAAPREGGGSSSGGGG